MHFSRRRLVRTLLFVLGSVLLLGIAYVAYGGADHVWAYAVMDAHRFTSRSMLTGALRYHSGVSQLVNDEQVYNGAGYTNWGFGVPLLQLPFHAVARHVHALAGGFFPDRAIFFLYLTGLVPVLWLSLDRALAGAAGSADPRWGRRRFCALSAACLVLVAALFPFMAYRALVYEETISYLVVAELYALCAYVHTRRSAGLGPFCALGIAAGIGLLIRVTGLVYLGVWAALVLIERRRRESVLAFASSVAPFILFWLASNQVRSGSPVSFGYANSNPWRSYHIPIQRFGSQCTDNVRHAWDVGTELFRGFFLAVEDPTSPHLQQCHFGFELQDWAVSPYGNEPFLGILVLLLLVWVLMDHVARGEGRLSVYVPYAAMVFLFLEFVVAGIGFAWRYAGDFAPLVALVGVQYVQGLPERARRGVTGVRMAIVLGLLSASVWETHVVSEVPSINLLDARGIASLYPRFEAARWGSDPTYAPHVDCHDVVDWPYDGGAGWDPTCSVDTYTNVYLGVRPAAAADGTRRELRMETVGMTAPTLRVYVNGRFYTARSEGGMYRASIDLDSTALVTPTVMATVEWTRGFEAPQGKLLWIELV